MNLELHLIQNFAPSNLNRSDTGAPKECIFGGYRRARISSQSFKRAMREYFNKNFSFNEKLADRSTRMISRLIDLMVAEGREAGQAEKVAIAAFEGIGLGVKEDNKTQYLLFLGRDEIKGFADICLEHFDVILSGNDSEAEGEGEKKSKKSSKQTFPKPIARLLLDNLDGGKAADLALFGRMLADLPDKNREAASQVAHAISTHKVGMEFDFFTAVDDLKPEDTSGADMLGTIEFNSACFYRYLNVNVDLLIENLGGDKELAGQTVSAFIRAATGAIPGGKQNTFATREMPSFVMATVTDGGFCSLANAFESPVEARRNKGLIEGSIEALTEHWTDVTSVYGNPNRAMYCLSTKPGADLGELAPFEVETLEALVKGVSSDIF